MSTSLRKCIVLGPNGTQQVSSPQNYRWDQGERPVHEMFDETNTNWVKISIHWHDLEPYADTYHPELLDNLDQQVNQAASHGRSIILMPITVPLWANEKR